MALVATKSTTNWDDLGEENEEIPYNDAASPVFCGKEVLHTRMSTCSLASQTLNRVDQFGGSKG